MKLTIDGVLYDFDFYDSASCIIIKPNGDIGIGVPFADETDNSVKPDHTLTLVDVMEHYEGEREYNGIIKECQKWFYGYYYAAPWCATWLSFCLAQMGLLQKTCGKKQENVYLMDAAIKNTGKCEEIPIDKIKKGDIIVLCFDGIYSSTAAKHITTACEDYYNESNYIHCIGGNQGDSISKVFYNINDIKRVWRPPYKESTLKSVRILDDRFPSCSI